MNVSLGLIVFWVGGAVVVGIAMPAALYVSEKRRRLHKQDDHTA
jgi:hypothetical protein